MDFFPFAHFVTILSPESFLLFKGTKSPFLTSAPHPNNLLAQFSKPAPSTKDLSITWEPS